MSRTPTHQVWIAERVASPAPWKARQEKLKTRGFSAEAARFILDDTAGAVSGYVLMLTVVAGICLGSIQLIGNAFDRQYDSVSNASRPNDGAKVVLASRGVNR